MTTETATPEYSHTQKARLCLILYGPALACVHGPAERRDGTKVNRQHFTLVLDRQVVEGRGEQGDKQTNGIQCVTAQIKWPPLPGWSARRRVCSSAWGIAHNSFADSGPSLATASRPTSPNPEILRDDEFAVAI